MNIQTYFNDLSNLYKISKQIETISIFNVGSNGTLNKFGLDALLNCIDGLNLKQAELVLSTKNLTSEQTKQVLVEAGLIASEEKIKGALVQRALAQAGLTNQQQEAILTESGLATVKNGTLVLEGSCTVEKLKGTLAQKGLNQAEIEGIVANLGLSTSNFTLLGSFKMLALSIWESVKAMAAFLFTSPVGMIITIGASLIAVSALIDHFNVTVDESISNLEEYSKTINELKSNLDNTTRELENVEKEIEKINEKESISLIDKEELSRLEKTREELLRTQKIQKELLKLEAEKTLKDINNSTNGKISSKYATEVIDPNNFGGELIAKQVTKSEELNIAIDKANQLQNKIDTLKNNFAGLENPTEKQAEEYKKELKETEEELRKAREYMTTLAGDIQTITTAYQNAKDAGVELTAEQEVENNGLLATLSLYEKLLDLLNGTVTAFDKLSKKDKVSYLLSNLKYSSLDYEEIEYFLSTLSEDDLSIIANIKFDGEQTANSIQEALIESKKVVPDVQLSDVFGLEDTNLSKLKDELDSIKSAYDTCLAAKEEYDAQGYLSVETLGNIISLGDEYLQYLFDENGAIQLDTEAFKNLTLAKIENMKYDSLATLSKNLSTIKDEASATAFLNDILKENTENLEENSLAELSNLHSRAMNTKNAEDKAAMLKAYNEALDYRTRLVALFDKTAAGIDKQFTGATKTDNLGYTDLFQQEYNALKHNLEMQSITQLDYYNGVQALNEKYFAGKEEFLDEYKQYEEEVYKGLLSYYKDYCDTTIAYYDSMLDNNKLTYQQYTTQVTALIKKMYKENKISAADYFNYEKTLLERQKEIYDRALSAVIALFDDEIEKIEKVNEALEKENEQYEKQKEKIESALSAVDKYLDDLIDAENERIDNLNKENETLNETVDNYSKILAAVDEVYTNEQEALQKQKDALQEKIDLIQDENDAYDLQYRKQQALYELERSQNQRSKLTFVNGQFVYNTDSNAIKEAQKNLDDIKTEELIDSIQKEQEALQKTIDSLEEYRTKWAEIASEREKILNRVAAAEYFGADYSERILGNHEDDYINFKDEYLKVQEEIDDNTSTIESYEEKVEYYEKLKKQYESLTGKFQEATDRQNAIELFGANWEEDILLGRLENLLNFEKIYTELDKKINDNTLLIESNTEKIAEYNKLKEEWNKVSTEYETARDKLYAAQLLGADWEKQVLSGRIDVLTNFKNDYIRIQNEIAAAAERAAQAQAQALTTPQNPSHTSHTGSSGGDDNGGGGGGGNENNDNPKKIVETTATDIPRKEYHFEKAADSEYQIIKNGKVLVTYNNLSDAEEFKRQSDNLKNPDGKTSSGDSVSIKEIASYNIFDENNNVVDTVSSLSAAKQRVAMLSQYAKGGIIPFGNNSLDKLAHSIGEDHIGTIAFREGERILTPTQNNMWEEWTYALPKLIDLSSILQNTKSLVPNFATSSPSSTTSSVTIGEVHLHEVNNVEDMCNQIKNRIGQELKHATIQKHK